MKHSAWTELIRPGAALLFLVVGCAVTAQFLSSGETLSEYAAKQAEETAPEDSAGTGGAGTAETEGNPGSPAEQQQAENGSAMERPMYMQKEANRPEEPPDTAPDGLARPSEDTTANQGISEPVTDLTLDDADVRSQRVTLAEGFFYEPIPDSIFRRMSGVSYPEGCTVPREELRYLSVRYVDFEDRERTGELVCHQKIAEDLTDIFRELYEVRYPLESVRLIDDFGGDDDRSMLANNTSCFNYRTVAGTQSLSNHAYGLAIDINPLYNPWVNHGQVFPAEAAAYADRKADFPHKITEEDPCYESFIAHGFFWGGHWNNPDYQHFQKTE